ncbi:Tapasin-related protein, partial [Dryobates pubescens]
LVLCGTRLALAAGTVESSTPVPPFRRVDVILLCSYVGEDVRGLHPAFRSSSSEHSAALVLRGISVRDDGNLDDVTEYKVPLEDSGSPSIVFEASVQSVSIPHAESLLHADCDGEEVNCEISPYSSQQATEGTCHTSWFMATMQLSGTISIALVLRGPHCDSPQDEEEHHAALHPVLRIPVSKEGTLLTTVEFQSSSQSTSLHVGLGSSVTLDCRFALAPSSSLSSLGWRKQHRGSGQSLFWYQVGSPGPTAQPKVHVDVVELLGSGDASLSLREASVGDEGMYICSVSTLLHQAQHIIQLQVVEPPRVHVIPAVVSFDREVTATLTCIIAGYYPLDVSVRWTQRTPENAHVEVPLPNTGLSSHRQNQDGTYSITSYLSISSDTAQAPATYSCHVSHVALAKPISVSSHLKAPENTGPENLLGCFIATVILIIVFIVLRRRAAKPKSEQLLRNSE